MAFPNYQSTAFVKIPERIEKQWMRGHMKQDNIITRIPNPTRHRYSAIRNVSLTVEYEPIETFSQRRIDLDAGDDEEDDNIRFWKENRLFWRDLEKAVESAIDSYIKQIREDLYANGSKHASTFSAPCMKHVEIEHFEDTREVKSHQDNSSRAPESVAEFRDEGTIRPDDSLTIATGNTLQDIIAQSTKEAAESAVAQYREALKKKKDRKDKHSHGSNKKGGRFAESVARYIAT